MKPALQTLILAALAVWPGPSFGQYRTEGATIRLVAEPPDAAGRIRGAVLFDLEPGWKTYWLDPGESGIAPQFDFSQSEGVEPPHVSLPPPERLVAEGGTINGYDEPMAVAFETTGSSDGRLVVSLFAGLCRMLCVPVAATLDHEFSTPLPLEDAMAIDRAFLALPRDENAVVSARIEGDTLIVEGPSPAQETHDLFVAGPAGWRFGAPLQDAGPLWRLPVRERPRDGHPPEGPLRGVFVDGQEAFALTIDLR